MRAVLDAVGELAQELAERRSPGERVGAGVGVDLGHVHEAHAVVEAVARVPQATRGGGVQLAEHRFHQLLVLVGPLGAGPVPDDGDGQRALPSR